MKLSRQRPGGYHLITILKLLALLVLLAYLFVFSFNFSFLSSPNLSPLHTNEIETKDNVALPKRAVLVGSAKNIAHYVPHTVQQLNRLGSIFQDYTIVISEDGSSDRTADIFREEFVTGTVIQNPEFSGDRLTRLAKARNVYLDHVKTKYMDWDYMIVFDLDFTCTLNLTTFREAVRLDSAWDAALSFSIGNYWDWLAFQPLPNKDMSRESFMNLLTTVPDDQFIQVGSAFAITAMYKISKLVDVHYGAEGMLIDHVILHRQLREKYGDNACLVSPLCFCENDCMKKY